ncbi:hypothetical protein, conserved [Perkinsus marinus ATCC 50983]|uniref:Calponin-homology (CH) domain-containing protein n=1 Tax=Perkinsus marinus (strain ATCC 50983 / TXsc) TaxID=423536 RepID=C5M0R9_PERM5|nr:hypothetical protein, conserved [Perkinsus marinus ATCC 50983]EEQ97427.1 hypothetical protein, conserved [Perkinsus marinus ATCC 50983]|eukprot:XP_002764710.1 hypothetical protein, conserved [Perkinsus marinus ATCC 50983]
MVAHESRAPPLADDDAIQRLYNWVDDIPLSRPKRNISRDFADGVMMAETVAHYIPKIVELHNYSQANALTQKMYNWNTLNQKVFRRMGFLLHPDDVEDCARAIPGSIERVLALVRPRLVEASRDGGQGRQFRSNSEQRTPRARSENSSSGARANSKPDISPKVKSERTRDNMPDREKDAIMAEKDRTISELRECVELLTRKISKLEQLVRIKDQKILTLQERLAAAPGSFALHASS